jgi:hypothetical protein
MHGGRGNEPKLAGGGAPTTTTPTTNPGATTTTLSGVSTTTIPGSTTTTVPAEAKCSQPVSTGSNPMASDCLFIVRSAVRSSTCLPECICDVDGAGGVSATDALTYLKKVVGQNVKLACPCGQSPSCPGACSSAHEREERPGSITRVEARTKKGYVKTGVLRDA